MGVKGGLFLLIEVSSVEYNIYMLSLLARKGRVLPSCLLTQSLRASFGGVYPPKTYDWRDDHSKNPYFQEDPRSVGTVDGHNYEYPHKQETHTDPPCFPDHYNPKDLTTNFVGTTPLKSVAETNFLNVPMQNIWDDISHQLDCQSQDLDFQPESVKGQHYRKRGLTWHWIIMALVPYWYVITEVIYNQMVDPDTWKYQRPPPLNYPDEEDTPDNETYENWQSPEFKYLHDAGLLSDPFFQIVDGKKVYSKWSGCNQPLQPIQY